MSSPRSSTEALAGLDGSRLAKRRLAQLLDLQAGTCSVRDACRILGLGRSQFYDLRARAFQAAVDALEPRRAGRPRKPVSAPATEHEVSELRSQVQRLQRELDRARTRDLVAALVGVRIDPQ